MRKLTVAEKMAMDAGLRKSVTVVADPGAMKERIAELEAGLREIERVASEWTIPDRHGAMIDSCNATCLNECVALARKVLRGDAMPNRQQK